MRTVDGGYQCGGCGYEISVPWIARRRDAADLPGTYGG